MSIDDGIALVGLVIFLSGIYLLLGLAAVLIILGLVMIFIGWRMQLPRRIEHNEPDKTTTTTVY